MHSLKLTLPLLATLMSLMGFAPAQDADQNREPAIATRLYGELDANVRLFRFVIEVDREGRGTLISLDEGNQKFKLDPFEFDDQKLNFEIKASRAVYQADFDSGKGTYEGTWKQSGADFPLSFRKVDEVPQDRPMEIWEGAVDALGQKLTLRFRLYDRDKHPVLMDSPDQRAGGFSGTIKKAFDGVVFEIPALRGKFTGKLDEDQKVLKGTWSQGAELPLELKKIEAKEMKKEAAPPRRPQTPKPPFPYDSQDVTIDNPSADLTLAGTLTIPKEGDRFPCVILISGSGPQDRNETLMDHQPFWVLADHFGRQGIACLRFDDRGTAQSTGDHDTATTRDFASDVSAIVDFLKNQSRIDPDRIGLCGHSEGGLIAPIVENQRDDIAFVVLLAGPGVNGEKILRSQVRLILEASGVEGQELEVATFVQDQLLRLALSGDEPGQEAFQQIVDRLIEKFPDQKEKRNQHLAQVQAGAETLATPWMKYFLVYDPAPALARMKCPVLALNGSKDLQVDPELNVPVIRQAFESTGKQNYEIEVLEGLNHLFQPCETGSISEYQTIEQTFSPIALEKISSWILKVTK